jgi:uncharacterized membrane protein YeaQ/YmgE (transglycosylase-associated protein family)
MGIVGCLILGLLAGAIARAIHPQPQPGGLTGMIVVGVVGAIVGATIAPAIGVGELRTFFSPGTWLVAVATAGGFLVAYVAILNHEHATARRPHGARG